jgi:hypothetical protein
MSKRTERREAERTARKLAYQQSRQQPPAAVAQAIAPITETDIAKAQAFFDQAFVEKDAPTPAQLVPDQPTPKPEISQVQLAANRANAQLSSGPVSIEGKAISSRNHTSHGLASDTAEGDHFQVLGNENQAAYDKDLADFRKEWKPTTATENDLVNRMVTHRWLRRRALRLQESLFDHATGTLTDTKRFDLYRRYETQHERSFNKVLADLQRLRSFQIRQQNGFESQRRKNEEHGVKMRLLNAKTTAAESKKSPANPLQPAADDSLRFATS